MTETPHAVGTSTSLEELGARTHDHVVAFYDASTYLADQIATFLGPTLQQGGIAIVIATPEHHAETAARLTSRRIPMPDERYLRFDAAEVLEAITRDGMPDPQRFEQVLGSLVRAHRDVGRPVVMYGEIVALQWAAGDVTGALRLEALWEDLTRRVGAGLLCGYPTEAFEHDRDTEAFRRICATHGAVVPSERFAELDGLGDQLRRVAILQQEAVAGANERDALRARVADLEGELARAEESDRLRARFASMAVHDLRNPTLMVAATVDLLRQHRHDLDDDEVADHLGTVARSTAQIERLVDDLLLSSQLGSGEFRFHPEPLDLGAVVDDAVDEARRTAGRTIEVERPDTLPKVFADGGRQRQILSNLLSNATKFSSETTVVTVTLSPGSRFVTVRVRDRGVGIAAHELPDLFRPFSRMTDRRRGVPGTGLGLYITKALVEGQGGTIEVDSQPDVGTTISYTVPLVRDEDEPEL
ncbi:hypothetical protein FTX61_13270 [Nitriliruptoraceae bacterium ZYF776]|nr:hypothetical protein [Profundirhabdus halotolerans]